MQIYYYTRTNRSKKIAEDLANKYNISHSQINKISDGKDWSGKRNFLRGGAMASAKKSLPAVYKAPIQNKKIIIIFPVWAGSLPPAVRTFVEGVRNNQSANFEMIAIPTSLGTKLKERAFFNEVIDLVGKEISIDGVNINC
ncbi:MAG: flavodoxin [bacterium]